MSASVTGQFANPDPNANPTNLAGLVTLLNTLSLPEPVSGGPFTPYVISSTTPAVADQDKAWFKTDGNGKPLGIYLFYSGNWRKVYRGNPSELRMFNGNPSTYFDATGLGIVGGEWDGFALTNGQNGTPNLSNQFIVGGAMDNVGITGYSSGWKTSVAGGSTATGGQGSIALINANLPLTNVQLSGYGTYDGSAAHTDKAAIVTGKYDSASATSTITLATIGATPQIAVQTLPPYFSLAFAIFVGYA